MENLKERTWNMRCIKVSPELHELNLLKIRVYGISCTSFNVIVIINIKGIKLLIETRTPGFINY
jgi:hypothetical protein